MEKQKDKVSLDDKIINWVSANLFCCFLILVIIIFIILLSVFGITAIIYKDKTILNPNEIGDAIGGMTAPIIGLFSALLVYVAFRAQIDANRNFEDKFESQKEIDFIQKRIEFIQNYVNDYEFHYIHHLNKQVTVIKGIAAFYEVGRNTENDIYNFEDESSFYQYGVRISYTLSQFEKILSRTNNSKILTTLDKKNFKKLLFDYWNDILQPPIERLIETHFNEFGTRGIYLEIEEYHRKISSQI